MSFRPLRLLAPLMILLSLLSSGVGTSAATATVMEPHQMWGGTLMLESGFTIETYASGLSNPRFMAFRPSDGMLFVVDSGGTIYTVPERGKTQVFTSGLQLPSSLAFHNDYLYVGETNEVVRFHVPGNAMTPDGPKEVVIPDLPTSGYHWTRTVAFGPDDKLYVAVGSDCESCVEDDPRRGAISVYNADGSNGRLFATGLRNPVGLAWQPGTNQMWITNNENDETGDDYLNSVADGGFYGWPYCYGPTPNTHYGDAARCANVPTYAAALGAHSTPLGLTFGDTFAAPAPYQQSIYVAEHGGYEDGTGYRVARIPVINGKAGKPEDFIIGWRVNEQVVWGRPAGITIGPDGAMYLTDDMRGILYRITMQQ